MAEVHETSWLEKASDHMYVPGAVAGRDEHGFIIPMASQPMAGIQRRFAEGGIGVNMYWSRPGEYFDDKGRPLPEEIAAMAGYDIKALGRQKAKLDAMSEAQKAIEANYKIEGTREVVEEREGYLLVHVGPQGWNIEFSDGGILNEQGPVTEEIARKIFNQLAPKPEKTKK